jgi:pectin methylesterase-like acyl-CoA thioesterase
MSAAPAAWDVPAQANTASVQVAPNEAAGRQNVVRVSPSLNPQSVSSAAPCYSTISEAVEAVATGGTVLVEAGSYRERLKLDRAVTIAAEPKVQLISKG